MRVLTPRLAAVLDNPVIEVIYCISIGEDFRMNSSDADVTLSNGVTFPANTMIMSIDPARLSSTVDRELYGITIADPDYSFREKVELGLIGKYSEVRACMVDQSTGQLITDIEDTMIIYGGTVGGVNYTIDTANIGSVTAVISLTSPMSSLDMTRTFYSSRDYIRQHNPDDSSFDQIYQGSGGIVTKWGKS